MKNHKILLVILVSLFVNYCTKNNSQKQFKATHICWIEDLRVRNRPLLNSKVITLLKSNDEVIKINDKESKKIEDDFVSWKEVILDGLNLRAPFIKVKTKNGLIGWVYKGGLSEIKYIDNFKITGVKNTITIFSLKDNKIILQEKISTHIKTSLHNHDYKAISSIECKINKPYLLVMPHPFFDPVYYYIGIFDVIKKKWVGKIYGYNMFYGLSPSKKYAYVDFGTGSLFRQAAIYSLQKNKVIFEFEPYSAAKWDENDILNFKMKIKKDSKTKNKIFVEHIKWKNGTLNRTGIIENVDIY